MYWQLFRLITLLNFYIITSYYGFTLSWYTLLLIFRGFCSSRGSCSHLSIVFASVTHPSTHHDDDAQLWHLFSHCTVHSKSFESIGQLRGTLGRWWYSMISQWMAECFDFIGSLMIPPTLHSWQIAERPDSLADMADFLLQKKNLISLAYKTLGLLLSAFWSFVYGSWLVPDALQPPSFNFWIQHVFL